MFFNPQLKKGITCRHPKLLPPYDLLVLFMAHERLLGEQSAYAPYMHILPPYVMTPIADAHFPAAALPAYGRDKLEKQRADFAASRQVRRTPIVTNRDQKKHLH